MTTWHRHNDMTDWHTDREGEGRVGGKGGIVEGKGG